MIVRHGWPHFATRTLLRAVVRRAVGDEGVHSNSACDASGPCALWWWLRATSPFTVHKQRDQLVNALLVLGQTWLAAGRPYAGLKLGSFESWSEVVGGILEVAGIPGFLGNLDELYETADVEGRAWREFVSVWWTEFKRRPVRASQLNELCGHHELMLAIRGGDSVKSQGTRLGHALQDARDRAFSTFRVCLVRDKGKHGKLYALEPTLASVNQRLRKVPRRNPLQNQGIASRSQQLTRKVPHKVPH